MDKTLLNEKIDIVSKNIKNIKDFMFKDTTRFNQFLDNGLFENINDIIAGMAEIKEILNS